MELNPHIVENLRLKGSKDLKESLPLYPIVRRVEEKGKIIFSTLVRKRYNKVYYLIPMQFEASSESRAIHGLHSAVYNYLMLGETNFLSVQDEDQINETVRLKNL